MEYLFVIAVVLIFMVLKWSYQTYKAHNARIKRRLDSLRFDEATQMYHWIGLSGEPASSADDPRLAGGDWYYAPPSHS